MGTNNLYVLIDYFVENGIEESEVDHLLKTEKILIRDELMEVTSKKTFMDLIRDGDWDTVWEAAQKYIYGEPLTVVA